MTFQRGTAADHRRSFETCARGHRGGRGIRPEPRPRGLDRCSADVIVRGEGEITFRVLLRALEAGASLAGVPGLSLSRGPAYQDRRASRERHRERRDSPARAERPRALAATPSWAAGRRHRDLPGLHFRLQLLLDHRDARPQLPPFSLERVIADIKDAHDRGARALFLVDDNITLDLKRFEALCQAILDAGLHTRRPTWSRA